MVERLHRRLKDALRARGSGLNWADHLLWVLLGLRTAAREDTGLSPAQAVLGCSLALPADRPDAHPLNGHFRIFIFIYLFIFIFINLFIIFL